LPVEEPEVRQEVVPELPGPLATVEVDSQGRLRREPVAYADVDHPRGELAEDRPATAGQENLLIAPAVPEIQVVIGREIGLHQFGMFPEELEEAPQFPELSNPPALASRS